jgi:hypothetical protein
MVFDPNGYCRAPPTGRILGLVTVRPTVPEPETGKLEPVVDATEILPGSVVDRTEIQVGLVQDSAGDVPVSPAKLEVRSFALPSRPVVPAWWAASVTSKIRRNSSLPAVDNQRHVGRRKLVVALLVLANLALLALFARLYVMVLKGTDSARLVP